MTTVTHSVATEAALGTAAADAAEGLDPHGPGRKRAFAVMAAALAAEGWQGKPAADLLGNAMDGYSNDELATARRDAQSITDPWAAWANTTEDAANAAKLLRQLLRENAPITAKLPEAGGTALDFDAPPAPPDWLIPGLIARGLAHLVSGPVHSFKSGLIDAAAVSGMAGRPFLGRENSARRWMIVEAENPPERVRERFQALGMTNALRENLHLTLRDKGVQLGQPEWNEWLRRELEIFRPDVLVLDTVSRACAVSTLDNDSVTALYRDVLVPLVDEFGFALVATHHERKGGGSGNRAEAALGGVQWGGQADQHVTVAPTTGGLSMEQKPDGSTKTRRPFVLRFPKGRALVEDRPEHFEVRGELAPDGALVSMTVDHGSEPTTEQTLVAALDTPRGYGALAEAVGLAETGRKFRDALARAVEAGLVVKSEDGLYERGNA